MKYKLTHLGLGLVGLAVVLAALLVLFENSLFGLAPVSQSVAGQAIAQCPPRPTREVPTDGPPITIPRPTIAPPPTAGAPPPVVHHVYPTLEHPLTTKKQVLRHLLEFDTRLAVWEEPWCVETLRLEPGRIKMKQYASEFAYSGVKQPPAYRDPGPIWVVTIQGEVDYSMPCIGCTTWPHAPGLRYTISKTTGMVGNIGSLPKAK